MQALRRDLFDNSKKTAASFCPAAVYAHILSGYSLRKEKCRSHVEVVAAAVSCAALLNLCLEAFCVRALGSQLFQLFQIVYLGLSVLEVFGRVVRGEYQPYVLVDIAFKLRDDPATIEWQS